MFITSLAKYSTTYNQKTTKNHKKTTKFQTWRRNSEECGKPCLIAQSFWSCTLRNLHSHIDKVIADMSTSFSIRYNEMKSKVIRWSNCSWLKEVLHQERKAKKSLSEKFQFYQLEEHRVSRILWLMAPSKHLLLAQ